MKAYALARGVYQRSILDGYEAWSGSTLKGNAKKYGGRYYASREAFLDRLRANGLRAYVAIVGSHSKLVLRIDSMGPVALPECHPDCTTQHLRHACCAYEAKRHRDADHVISGSP